MKYQTQISVRHRAKIIIKLSSNKTNSFLFRLPSNEFCNFATSYLVEINLIVLKKSLFSIIILAFWSVTLTAQNTPVLTCVFETTNNNNELTWEYDDICMSNFNSINIYESASPTGPFTLKKEVLIADQTNDILSALPGGITYYYLRAKCNGIESPPSDTLSNLLPPAPSISGVSVFIGQVLLTWNHLEASNIGGYIVYVKGTQGLYEVVDTVCLGVFAGCPTADFTNPTTITYTDAFAEPGETSLQYSITSMDFCGNSGAALDDGSHTTIHLTTEHDSCSNMIGLQWTPYQGWDNVDSYNIFKVIGGTTELITNVPGNEFSFDYIIQSSDVTPILFNVVASDGVNSSTSNNAIVDIDIAALPAYINMRNVSVVNENQIQLEWNIDENGAAEDLYINRGPEINSIGIGVELGPLTFPPQTKELDPFVDTQQGAFYYTISAQNTCGVTVTSDTARSIFLTGQDNFDLTNGLSWNPLEIEGANILQYTLYRVDGNNDLTVLGIYGANDIFQYIDDVSDPEDAAPVGGQYCYLVECQFESQFPGEPIRSFTSFSNKVCISQTTRIFVPNAFAPNGVNNVFKPVFVYPNEQAYQMTVFNRWGEIVFETTDPNQGWDGTVRDVMGPQGVYAYYIKMEATNGNLLERKGTVLLIR